jgi:hypothetical protein
MLLYNNYDMFNMNRCILINYDDLIFLYITTMFEVNFLLWDLLLIEVISPLLLRSSL